MNALPIRRAQFDVRGFKTYLTSNGCEVGEPTNPHEVMRYLAYWAGSKKPTTHIVSAKSSGLLTWTGGSQQHYRSFLAGEPIADILPATQPTAKPKTSKTERLKLKIISRDGPDCWFCGKSLGDDCTIEHLIPKASGGVNSLANYVAAHRLCNGLAADKPLVEKFALRASLRGVAA